MRYVMLLLSLGFLADANAGWEGNGTYESPYQYTAPVQNGQYFIVRRGQTLNNTPQYVIEGMQVDEYLFKQIQTVERFKVIQPGMGIMRWKHEGTFQELDYSVGKKQDAAGNWKRIYEDYEDFSGTIAEFVDPTNPPEVVGVFSAVTVKSKMNQDIPGDVGNLKVSTKVINPNPNPNSDPPADEWKFEFSFSLPANNWSANVHREVNGTVDIDGNDAGVWSSEDGTGTNVTLPNPTQPLSGHQADWYLDGTNTDDAWILLNNVHYHPGPITFSFVPHTQAYLTQYKP